MLLVHGFPLDHSMWQKQIETLSRHYRVIAPDLRGFGRSPLAASDADAEQMAAGGRTMRDYADDLAALLDALGVEEPITFAGFSMGGYIAWQFWRNYAQRMGALVLCDTRAAADDEPARAGRLEVAEHVAQWGSARVADTMLPKLFTTATLRERPVVVEPVRAVISATDPRAIAAAQRGMAERPDVTEWLPQIDLPALVIVGRQDAISPLEEMRSIARMLPRGELTVVPNAGHMAPVENPEAVNTALERFLGTLPP